MHRDHSPLLVEGDSCAAANLSRAFEAWAGRNDVKVFFEPDTSVPVGCPSRGRFVDAEVHFLATRQGSAPIPS